MNLVSGDGGAGTQVSRGKNKQRALDQSYRSKNKKQFSPKYLILHIQNDLILFLALEEKL